MTAIKNLNPKKKQTLSSIAWMISGNLLYAFGVNVIIVPLSLYNGGFMGISQLIQLFISKTIGITGIAGVDLLGIIYFLVNIPLFVLAYKVIGHKFCLSSLISIGMSSACLTVMPSPETPIVDDTLTACLIGGVLVGTGAGMVLRSGSSGGGQDIIGLCLAKTRPNVSVGVIAIMVNAVIFGICFFIFDIEVVIYSLIYNVILNLFLDRMYVQNINIQVMIFTKQLGISDAIMTKMGRGVTNWDGAGAYTKETSYILVTVISKYEVNTLVELAHEVDPHAFIITNEGARVYGNFQKRLTLEETMPQAPKPDKE